MIDTSCQLRLIKCITCKGSVRSETQQRLDLLANLANLAKLHQYTTIAKAKAKGREMDVPISCNYVRF
jgi:hypothetical protein